MKNIVTPFPTGRGRGWTWLQHKAHKLQGGTDYEIPSGVSVRAPHEGRATDQGGNVIRISYDANNYTQFRHVKPYGRFPRDVDILERVGTSGADGGLWPHIERWYKNTKGVWTRATFESLLKRYQFWYEKEHAKAVKLARYAKTRRIARYLNARFNGTNTAAATTGRRGPVYYGLLRRFAKAQGIQYTVARVEARIIEILAK